MTPAGYARDRVDRLATAALGKGLQITAAESCTGGLLATMITDTPGASAYFRGSVVAYADEVKKDLLGVEGSALKRHGAVSEEVAVQMAEGARVRVAADVALAVTGVAGPAGGTESKPVGTVWIAVATSSRTVARLHRFDGDREAIRLLSVGAACEMGLEAVAEGPS